MTEQYCNLSTNKFFLLNFVGPDQKKDTCLTPDSSQSSHSISHSHSPQHAPQDKPTIMGLCSSIKDVKMVANPSGDKKKQPQPQTKDALRSMIEKYCEGKKSYGEPNTWDVTLVTDMSYLFSEMKTFNAPIDQWNTSEVTDMSGMFYGASSFNQPITMDTSQVTDMSNMFEEADAMTHPLPQTKEMIAVSNYFLKVLQNKIKSRSLIIFYFFKLTFFF